MGNNAKESVAIVWYKRDLRIHDHEPLTLASQYQDDGIKVLPLYIVEPDFWALPDASARHWRFIQQSLTELNQALENLGQGLIIEHDDAVSVFEKLNQQFDIQAIYSHQESGNLWTYQRDKDMIIWCFKNRIKWHESEVFGVFRRFNDRDHWAHYWEKFMARQRSVAPASLEALDTQSFSFSLPKLTLPVLENDEHLQIQLGGRSQALFCYSSFLKERGRNYSFGMSSPLTAFSSCSRLSPHITFGTISLREVVQKLRKELKEPSLDKMWARSLRSFDSRLHWHCHFMQKLETEPLFETHNMLQIFNGLREDEFNDDYFEAWATGNTGYPLIDACMRCLRHTGWINFRMRAMLVSFSSYQLWLHWQKPAWHLAQCFTDYEPGIHYSQIQMQSGTTGINTMRIYNPVKQSQDQDPKGIFIKRWIPELSKYTDNFIHEPWTMPLKMQQEKNCIIGEDYPEPIVDHVVALREARARFADFKKLHPDFWEHARALNQKHGSRRKKSDRMISKRKSAKAKSEVETNQLTLF
ncbi:deoxyribodipyrimidine photo-lyase [Leucothrix sargassi]|nr:deoxyribodipyrimidine photo-lyase [Leucothrix sargassi]